MFGTKTLAEFCALIADRLIVKSNGLTVEDNRIKISAATTSAGGVMSAADKVVIDTVPTLGVLTAQVESTAAGPDSLLTVATAAGLMGSAGDQFEIDFGYQVSATDNSKTMFVDFGGQTIYTIATPPVTAGNIVVRLIVTRLAAAGTVNVMSNVTYNGVFDGLINEGTTADVADVNFASVSAVQFYSTVDQVNDPPAASDVILRAARVKFIPAA
jgi:hypothetical protein